MGPLLVNTKQKIAVLASGLVIATTGLVTDAQPTDKSAPAPSAQASARTS